MNCPGCSSVLNAPGDECPRCGATLEALCDGCGRRWAAGAAFCAGCGARLTTLVTALPDNDSLTVAEPTPSNHAPLPTEAFEGERRVVTIVMSDLSGYTAMCEKFDPELISEIMGTIKRDGTAIVESFGGIVNQFKGDEIISLFGLPTAGVDDARRAVSAALAIHARVTELNSTLDPPPPVPLSMHTGIHTGRLIVEINDSRDGLYGLTGDAINTAARLLGLAGRGELVIGAPTKDLVAPYFEIEDAGQHTVRNKVEPLSVFRVQRELPNRSRFDAARERGLTTLAGREEELRRLADELFAARSGGRLVVIEADAGTGKSRLCYEFVERARALEPELAVVKGRCQAYGTMTSYLPFIQVLRETLRVPADAPVDDVLATAPGAVADLDPGLTRFTPAYLHLLSAIGVKDLPAEWRDDALPDTLQDAIVALVLAAAKTRPTVVQLDDWHWADDASHATLLRLQRGLASAPALVVVSQRPGAPQIGMASASEIIALQPLTATTTDSMIAGYFGAESTQPDLSIKIYERTLGNPFFVEEVCAALRSQSRVRTADRQVQLIGDVNELVIPDTVQAVVLGRVDALSPALRDVLRAASVIGREFRVGILAQLTDPLRLAQQLAELDGFGFVEQMDAADRSEDARYRFRHVITQEVTYDTLLVRRRKLAHGRVARAIEESQTPADVAQRRMVEALAHHYQRAGNSEKAVDNFELAGRKATERRALVEARLQLRAAIDESHRLAQTAAVRDRRGRIALLWAAACIFLPSPSQIGLLAQVQGEAVADGNAEVAILANYWINWIQYSIGNQRAAEAGTRTLLELMERSGNAPTIALARCHLGQILVSQNRVDEAELMLVEGLTRPPGTPADGSRNTARVSGLYCYSLAQLALVHAIRGSFDESRAVMAEAMHLVRRSGERATEASLNICSAIAAVCADDWPEVLASVAAISLLPEASVSPHVRVFGQCLYGYATFRQGAHDEGLRVLRRAVVAHEQSEGHLSLGLSRAWLADALFRSGHVAEAGSMARASLTCCDIDDRLGETLAADVLLQAEAHRQNPQEL